MDYKKMINKDNNGRFEDYVVAQIDRLQRATQRDVHEGDINPEYLVLLNDNNSDIIEEKISNDNGYIQFTKMVVEYYKLNNHRNPNVFPREDRTAVFAVVRMIDVENSTNVWRFNRDALTKMVDKIMELGGSFWESLISGNDEESEETNSTRKQLVDMLAESGRIEDAQSDEDSNKGPQPRSLASKICKYFAQYICGDEEQKLYFINDSFVRQTLPFYYHYYVNESYKKPKSYEELFDLLETVRLAANEKENSNITRGRMDHIMWYCYKNSGNTENREKRKNLKKLSKKDLKEHCQTFITIYGVLPLSKVFEFLHGKYETTEEDLERDIQTLEGDFKIVELGENKYLVGKKYSDDDLNNFIGLQLEFGYYDVSKSKKITNKPNHLNDSNTNKDNIIEKMSANHGEFQLERVLESINAFMLELSKPDVELSSLSFDLQPDNDKDIKRWVKNMKNNTRLPCLGGYTMAEIKKRQKAQRER